MEGLPSRTVPCASAEKPKRVGEQISQPCTKTRRPPGIAADVENSAFSARGSIPGPLSNDVCACRFGRERNCAVNAMLEERPHLERPNPFVLRRSRPAHG